MQHIPKTKYSDLTEDQKTVIDNLTAGREIYYFIDNLTIQELVLHGWIEIIDNEVKLKP